MRKHTAKEKKQLESNPYTYKVTDHKLMFTAEFKKAFWRKYEAGEAPRAILTELGYDTEMFGQKQIDSMVQSMKRQAASGMFREGSARDHRAGRGAKPDASEDIAMTEENFSRLWHELSYLREEVELLIKIRTGRCSNGRTVPLTAGEKFGIIKSCRNANAAG